MNMHYSEAQHLIPHRIHVFDDALMQHGPIHDHNYELHDDSQFHDDARPFEPQTVVCTWVSAHHYREQQRDNGEMVAPHRHKDQLSGERKL